MRQPLRVTVIDLVARKRIGKRRILVRPERSAVSGFCTELTGLTKTVVDSGVSLAEACARSAAEHAAAQRGWASWRDYDRKHFLRQCESTSVPYPLGAEHVNAKEVFADAFGLPRPGGDGAGAADPVAGRAWCLARSASEPLAAHAGHVHAGHPGHVAHGGRGATGHVHAVAGRRVAHEAVGHHVRHAQVGGGADRGEHVQGA